MFINGLDELLLVLSTRYDKTSKVFTVLSTKYPRIALDVVRHKIVDLKHLGIFFVGGATFIPRLLFFNMSFAVDNLLLCFQKIVHAW